MTTTEFYELLCRMNSEPAG